MSTREPARPPRAVVFDWGGTITPWHTIDLRAPWTAFADGVGAIACQRNDIAGQLYAAADDAWRVTRTEGRSACLEDLLTAVGFPPGAPTTTAGLAAYDTFWDAHTVTHPVIPDVWEALRDKGLRIGVLSNTIWSRERHRAIFERDGVLDLIDADVYSSEVEWAKPRPEIFLEIAARLGVEPAECVYVGDRGYEDVHGPQQVGMRAVLVPHSDIPVEQQVDHSAEPDAVAHDLADLPGIVEQWLR